MKYTSTIEPHPDGSLVIAFAIKCTKQDLDAMIKVCDYPHELSVPQLKKYYSDAPASRFLQALAQFCFWGEIR